MEEEPTPKSVLKNGNNKESSKVTYVDTFGKMEVNLLSSLLKDMYLSLPFRRCLQMF